MVTTTIVSISGCLAVSNDPYRNIVNKGNEWHALSEWQFIKNTNYHEENFKTKIYKWKIKYNCLKEHITDLKASNCDSGVTYVSLLGIKILLLKMH